MAVGGRSVLQRLSIPSILQDGCYVASIIRALKSPLPFCMDGGGHNNRTAALHERGIHRIGPAWHGTAAISGS